MLTKEALEYISNQRKLGKTTDEIKKLLLAVGWNEKEIEDHFQSELKPVGNANLTSPATQTVFSKAQESLNAIQIKNATSNVPEGFSKFIYFVSLSYIIIFGALTYFDLRFISMHMQNGQKLTESIALFHIASLVSSIVIITVGVFLLLKKKSALNLTIICLFLSGVIDFLFLNILPEQNLEIISQTIVKGLFVFYFFIERKSFR